ncbi:hypothetical protein ABIF38_008943 [Bradyrhizobium japonicum]|jgi:hypothetical protein|uniref:Uncharacterized protein n=1 Tax=Bradyrhizobium elkanii TaxID=29448 RepID=A0ABV4EUR5_BRAEL|nr:hypothetical protein [Bradyrhizobium elkanii]
MRQTPSTDLAAQICMSISARDPSFLPQLRRVTNQNERDSPASATKNKRERGLRENPASEKRTIHPIESAERTGPSTFWGPWRPMLGPSWPHPGVANGQAHLIVHRQFDSSNRPTVCVLAERRSLGNRLRFTGFSQPNHYSAQPKRHFLARYAHYIPCRASCIEPNSASRRGYHGWPPPLLNKDLQNAGASLPRWINTSSCPIAARAFCQSRL